MQRAIREWGQENFNEQATFSLRVSFKRALLVGAFATAWLVVDGLTAFIEPYPHFSVWYVPAAISIGLFLVAGPRYFWLPPVMEIVRSLVFERHLPGLSTIVYAALTSGSYAIAIYVLKRRLGVDTRLRGAREFLLGFIVVACAAGVNAAFANLFVPELHRSLESTVAYWTGNVYAIATYVPAIVWAFNGYRMARVAARFGIRPYDVARLAELFLATAATAAAIAFALSDGLPFSGGHSKYLFPVLLPVLWLAARFQSDGAVWANLFTGAIVAAFLAGAHPSAVALYSNELFGLTLAIVAMLIGLTAQGERIALNAGRMSRRRFETALAASPLIELTIDADSTFRSSASRLSAVLGFTDGSIDRLDRVVVQQDRSQLHERIDRLHPGRGDADEFDLRLVREDQGISIFSVLLVPTEDDPADRTFVALLRDITKEREVSERLRLTAFVDPITSLPNRTFLEEHLAAQIAAADSTASFLHYVHFPQMREIRNAFGIAVLDDVLRSMARRLTQTVPAGSLVCRIGWEDFAVLLPQDGAGGPEFAERIIESAQVPLEVADAELVLLPNVGIARYPQDAAQGTSVLNAAGEAARQSATFGAGRFAVASVAVEELGERLKTIAQLQYALKEREFVLHYQPIVSLKDGRRRIAGVEALLRWNHPTRGLLLPAAFLDVLESTRLIDAVGEWVLERACADAIAWDGTGQRLEIAANVSLRQIWNARFARRVAEIVSNANFDPLRLTLEITESVAANDIARTTEIMRGLRATGVSIALDDFGVGNSSLSRLRDMPIQTLKLDRSFVASLENGARAQSLAQAIVSLSHALGLRSVAEGVESLAQLELLSSYGCDYAQGFLLGRPVPASDIRAMLVA